MCHVNVYSNIQNYPQILLFNFLYIYSKIFSKNKIAENDLISKFVFGTRIVYS